MFMEAEIFDKIFIFEQDFVFAILWEKIFDKMLPKI